MAYNVSEKYRKQCYSGVSMFNSKLTINGVQVPYSQIKSIKITSPIIDESKDQFSIGSFISQKLTITFRNLNNLDIKSGNEVELEIGQIIDGIYEYCPIGKYLIDDLREDYQTTCQIDCLDYSIKFKQAVNYLQEGEELDTFSISVDDLLKRICNICGVELGDYPTTNGDKIIHHVNSETSGKEYISYIAELKGCNAKMSRDGKLTLVPLKQANKIKINALKSKTWILGEKYEISHVAYFDGVPTLHTFPEDETIEEKNKLIIRQTNPFITGVDNSDTIDRVKNIYDVVKDFVAWNITNENYGDPSMDAWDIIEFELGTETYQTFNNNSLIFEQNIMTNINTKIPTKQQEVLVNVYDDGNLETTVKKITKAEIDPLKQTITQVIEKVDEHGSTLVKVQSSLDGFETRIEKNENSIADFKVSIDGIKLDMTKTGNNLIRNTMFYDFEGWTTLDQQMIAISKVLPDPNYVEYWYCTNTHNNYENGIVYKREWVHDESTNTDTAKWIKTDIQFSHLEKSFPLGNNWTILSNETTRQQYISGRALSVYSDNTIPDENWRDHFANGDRIYFLDKEEEMTISFKITTSMKNGGFFIFSLVCTEEINGSHFISQPMFSIAINDNLNNQLITQKVKIPRSKYATNVFLSETEPNDKAIHWLKMITNEYGSYGELKKYNNETSQWENIAIQGIIKDQDDKLYYSSYQIIYDKEIFDEPTPVATYHELSDDGGNFASFNSLYGLPRLYIGNEEINSSARVEIADIKLEYGNYSEWTPKDTEVMGTTHLLDETGYKIKSGDDNMRLMVDELAQYYKDQKTFYINKTEVYSKNARSETSDVSGLITMSFSKGVNKIYGRHIK